MNLYCISSSPSSNIIWCYYQRKEKYLLNIFEKIVFLKRRENFRFMQVSFLYWEMEIWKFRRDMVSKVRITYVWLWNKSLHQKLDIDTSVLWYPCIFSTSYNSIYEICQQRFSDFEITKKRSKNSDELWS